MTLSHSARIVGWILLFGVALVQTLAGLMLLLSSGTRRFTEDTGIQWSELASVYPTVARQIASLQQSVLVFSIAVGLFALVVSYFAFRTGQRWAWFAMWLLPAGMAPGTLSMTRIDFGVAVMGVVFVLAAVAGLLLAAPGFFRQRA